MKRNLKKIFTFALLAFGFAAGSNAQASAAKLAIDAANFPDNVIRNALTRTAKNYTEDSADDGMQYTKENGVYYVNTDEITCISTIEEDGTVQNADCLKVFPNLSEVYFDKVDASSLKFANSVNYLGLAGITSSSIHIEADALIYLTVNGTQKVTSLSLSNWGNLETVYLSGVKVPSFDGAACQNLSSLSLQNTQTSSVKGLESMKQLNSFSISGSTLSSIDLTANKKLTTVYASDNKKLASAKLPDGLLYLYLSDNNLKSVNVKKMKKLLVLDVSGNKNLKAIDISSNKNLYSVSVNNTAISKLNTAKNTKLTSLSCYKSKVKSLNLGKNKDLGSLDVSGNKKLTSLNVSKNKKLFYFSYYGSGIKKMNFSKQKQITLSYSNLKKGKSVSLKNIIGTGYKVTYSDNGIKYNKKNGSFKVTKKGYAYLTLKKGKTCRYVSVYVK